MAVLVHLGEQILAEPETDLLFCHPAAKETTWFDPEVALPYDQKTWDSILLKLQRPWFDRIWTVQEIQLLAKKLPGAIIQCGQEIIGCGHLRT